MSIPLHERLWLALAALPFILAAVLIAHDLWGIGSVYGPLGAVGIAWVEVVILMIPENGETI